MIVRYAYEHAAYGRREAEVTFDASGVGRITRADDDYIKAALAEALSTALYGEVGEYRNGALLTISKTVSPGSIEHMNAMINPSILVDKGIRVVGLDRVITNA